MRLERSIRRYARIHALRHLPMDSPPPVPPSTRSWSIHGRSEITTRYSILNLLGSGTYSDVYRAVRLSDNLPVALKEIHDYQSAAREIESLQLLRDAPNVVDLIEYFWREDEDEDAVLVLEFLDTDLGDVIKSARRSGEGIAVGEVKRWMLQILKGVGACHERGVVHRDLKPANLLVSANGILKLADFGQSRILQETMYMSIDNKSLVHQSSSEAWTSMTPPQLHPHVDGSLSGTTGVQDVQDCGISHEEDSYQDVDGVKSKYPMEETVSWKDGDTSCLATCSTPDAEDDPFKGQDLAETYEGGELDSFGELTSCVGTRWFKAPELLYGSTSYGHEIDLWSLGCIFAELFNLDPLFPGLSDIDQLSKIINTLGNITEESWPGCSKLPDYGKISFNKVVNPIGLESCLRSKSDAEVNIVKRLLCYNPMTRASAKELLHDRYFIEEPLPVPLNELKVPAKSSQQEEDSSGEWCDYRDLGSDSNDEGFGSMDISTNEKGFSIRFL